MGQGQGSSIPDRAATYAVLIGVVLGLAHLAGALVEPDVVRGLLARAGLAVAIIAGGGAVGMIASRIAAAMSRTGDLSRQMAAAAADRSAEHRELLERLGGIALAVSKPARHQDSPAPLPLDGDGIPEPTPDPVPTPVAHPQPAPVPAVDHALADRIVALLDEIREVSLMNDEQRQLRLKQHLESKRKTTLDQVYHCFRAGHWATADQLLGGLEAQFPTDAAVKQARGEFHRQRAAAETHAFAASEERVRDLARVGSWERAIAAAQEFVNNFPANVEGRHLLTQVYREFDASRDAAFQRLYEEVQANVDRRLWRAALVDAQRLLEQFPNHARANRIRQQLKTIAENADIEERQEHEVRIQLLVKTQRFAEAVELAEQVVRQYPDSPQAEALEERLPQLRELAQSGDGNAA